ncbi:MAG: hypothetical protein ACI3WT_07960 [Phascolarctobacterium sp.]
MGMIEAKLAQELQRRGIATDLYVLKPQQEKITLMLGAEEALCQAMEECSELATACNQYRRTVLMKGQPTSKTPDVAITNLKEELVDTIICIKELIMILGIDYDDLEKIEQEKTDRTARRLGL